MTRKTAPWARKLGAISLGVLASALLAEGLARYSGLAPEVAVIERGRFQLSTNVKLGYEPRPLRYEGDALGFYDYRGASNRLGYRDRDHPVRKPAGACRVLILGDSIGAGLKVERYADTFPALLEALLLAAGQPVEVLNFSVSGYNTQQEVETLKERGLAFGPDVVVVAYCLNDRFLSNGAILEALIEQQLLTPGVPATSISPTCMRSALLRLIRYRILSPYSSASGEDLVAHVAGDTVEVSLRELGRLSATHGFEVLLAVVPLLDDLSDYRFTQEHDRLRGIAAEASLGFVDLLEPLRACASVTGGPSLARDAVHPSELGHRCIAEALSSHLLEHVLASPVASNR